MARERIKTIRPDATGFGKSVTTGAKRPPLGTISDEAIKNFKATSAETSPVSEVSAPERAVKEGDIGQTLFGPDAPAAGVEPTQSSTKRETNTAPKTKASPSNDRLASLVVPQRAGSKPGAPYTLRLRVLERHAEAMEKLEDQGIPRTTVLKAAYASMPAIIIEPHYVPQSTEASGPAEWSHRITAKVDPQILRSIAAAVRNGNKAPKSALLLGQIEPNWFSSLDSIIKDFEG